MVQLWLGDESKDVPATKGPGWRAGLTQGSRRAVVVMSSGEVASPVVVRALRVTCLRQLRPGSEDPFPRQSQKTHLHHKHTAVMPTLADSQRVGGEKGGLA